MINNKIAKIEGRKGLGTAGRIRRRNKKLSSKKVRNGKLSHQQNKYSF